MSKPYLIIGSQPGQGETYLQEVFEAVGFDVGVGEPGTDGVLGWQHLIMSHPWTLKALRKGRRREKVYIMQIGHPVPTINTIANMYLSRKWPPLPGNLPIGYMFRFEKTDTPLIKSTRIYYHLNEQGLKDPKFKLCFPIEEIESWWDKIAEAIGVAGTSLPDVTMDEEKTEPLEWRDIFDAIPNIGFHIGRLSDCMGYDVGEWQQTELSKWASKVETNPPGDDKLKSHTVFCSMDGVDLTAEMQKQEEKENEGNQSRSTGNN